MPSALLWAYLAEIKFLYWQFRLIASVPPRGKADPLSLVALLLASSPEGRAFWQCGKVGRHEVKLPPRERLPPAGGRWRSQKGEQLARRQP